MQLFEELGVPLKTTERGRRVFPQATAPPMCWRPCGTMLGCGIVRGSAKKLLLEDGVCKGAVTDRGETLRAETPYCHRRHQLPGHRQRR